MTQLLGKHQRSFSEETAASQCELPDLKDCFSQLSESPSQNHIAALHSPPKGMLFSNV